MFSVTVAQHDTAAAARVEVLHTTQHPRPPVRQVLASLRGSPVARSAAGRSRSPPPLSVPDRPREKLRTHARPPPASLGTDFFRSAAFALSATTRSYGFAAGATTRPQTRPAPRAHGAGGHLLVEGADLATTSLWPGFVGSGWRIRAQLLEPFLKSRSRVASRASSARSCATASVALRRARMARRALDDVCVMRIPLVVIDRLISAGVRPGEERSTFVGGIAKRASASSPALRLVRPRRPWASSRSRRAGALRR